MAHLRNIHTPKGLTPPRFQHRRRPVGERVAQRLVQQRVLSPADLATALALYARQEADLGSILLANDMVREADLLDHTAAFARTRVVDVVAEPPDISMSDGLNPNEMIRLGYLPWRRAGGAAVIALDHAADPDFIRERLSNRFDRLVFVYAPRADLRAAINDQHGRELSAMANLRCPEDQSCRNLPSRTNKCRALAILLVIGAAVGFYPWQVLTALLALGILLMMANLGLRLRILADRIALARRAPEPLALGAEGAIPIRKLPTVSILVPLYKEANMLPRLVARLMALEYPKELLDVCLIVEECDTETRAGLSRLRMPESFQVVVVPLSGLKTKPRAMNYALPYCRGSIVGIYDAEDRPEHDQIHKAVAGFWSKGPKVAALQARLDFYNPTQNWISRCFTLDYAAWFSVILPGFEGLRMPLPLGGTSVFFRRHVLEQIGAWDAHNVTEDADLGIRLARFGYRTEAIDSTTFEEANCHFWPWIRQRSRWLKGYAMTWATHMRRPLKLYGDLGSRGFWGMQLLFVGTLSTFLLTPVFLLAMVLTGLGLAPGIILESLGVPVLTGGFLLLAEIIFLGLPAFATRDRAHRGCWPYLPLLHIYFLMGSIAAWRALFEVLTCPFHWEKTAHGISPGADPFPEPGPSDGSPAPRSDGS